MRFNINYLTVIGTALVLASPCSIATQTGEKDHNAEKKMKTAKEKLGKKWSDHQRVNNCKVPVEERGTKPRPVECVKR